MSGNRNAAPSLGEESTLGGAPIKNLAAVTTKIGSGATPRGGNAVYRNQGIAFIRSQNILDLSISPAGMAFIDDEAARALANVTVRRGDVLVNITGDSVARVSVWESDDDARVSQHVAIVRPDPARVNSRYLQYWLVAPSQKSRLLSLSAAGGSRKALTKSMLEQFPFGPHGLLEQQGIAEVLGALDDKIAANRRVIETAEKLLAAKVDRHLTVERPLWDTLDIVFGEPFRSSEFTVPKIGRPLIRIRDLKSQQCQVWTTESRIRERTIKPGDVLVGMDAEFRAVRWSGPRGVLNQRMLLAESQIYGQAIVCRALRSPLARIEHSKSGTTVIHLNKADLERETAMVPPDHEIGTVRTLADPLWTMMTAAEAANVTLASTRDELLPLLMSGKITVRDAELAAEEAL